MKADVTDVTFLMLIRLDSIQRLENILVVTDALITYFDTHVNVVEASSYQNGLLKSLLNRKINYRYQEDKDPVLYKTKHFNAMIRDVSTKYIAIWDADVVVDKKAVLEAITILRNEAADVAYPYNGNCFNISAPLRSFFFKRKDIRVLYRHKKKWICCTTVHWLEALC